jgi:hypothetical protein
MSNARRMRSAAMDETLDGYVQVPIPESWEFWTGMYDAGVETGIPLSADHLEWEWLQDGDGCYKVPAVVAQPDPVAWLNDRILYWTSTP